MELKTQIQLVILIPILLILLLADFQVAMLGFLSIPSFQDSLLEFHINRHLNGLIIETNILQQEVYIQYQSYFNQIFGVSAHLRHYAFGEFQNESSWSTDLSMLNPSGFLAPSNEISSPFKIDWYHENYSSLEDMNGSTSYGRLVKAVQSIGLADIVINNSRSLLDDIEMDPAQRERLRAEKNDEQFVPIDYEFIEVVCSDSLVVRYPRFNVVQVELLKEDVKSYYNNSFFNMSWKEDTTLVREEDILLSFKNFSLSFAEKNEFSDNFGVLHLSIMFFEDESTGIQCVTRVKVLNNYLVYISNRHLEQRDQYEKSQDLFVGLLDDAGKRTMIPQEYENFTLAESLVQYLYNRTSKDVDEAGQKKHQGSIANQLSAFIAANSSSSEKKYFVYNFNGFDVYFLVAIVNIKSTKTLKAIMDPDTGARYLHINPEGNAYTLPAFIIVHCFIKQQLVDELYRGTSLSNVQMLEIIVFIVIVVLSIIIFVFVWFIANRIGLSFEQPIRLLTNFMNSIDIQNMESQDEELMAYEDYFNSFEIQALFRTMNIFITTIKYSNQKYSNSKHSDAIALMELSRAKDFYKKEIGNMSAVGICANNIGVLHMKGQRVFEAVNEIEEAIFIGKQELLELKEQKKWCQKMVAALQEPNFYQNFKQKLQGLANKFRQLEFGWVNRFNRKKSDAQKSRSKASSRNLVVSAKSGSKNISATQMNLTKNLGPQMALLSRQTNLTHTPQLISRKKSLALPPGGEFLSSSKNNNYRDGMVSQDQEAQPLQNWPKNVRQGSQNQASLVQSYRADLKESILSESVRQHQSNEDELQVESVQTDQELFEEQLAELQKKKMIVKAKLQNRQFQLAQFMFNICMQYSDVFIPETLSLFQQFEDAQDKHPGGSQSHQVRMINLYVKKALCYIQIGDIQKFKIEQAKAEEGYQKLRSGGGQDKQDKEDFNFVDMFKNVPNEILWAKILQLRAIFELLQGNFQTAAGILTEIVDLGEHYDPEVRDFCLVLLENIFKLFNLPTKPLKQFKSYISINVFEVVMLIDYSKEMTTEQINISHSICNRIFSILQPQDLVGLYGFNNQLHEAFPLQPKGIYKDLLQKQIFMAVTAPGGKSRLYQSMKFAVKNFFEHRVDFSRSKVVDSQVLDGSPSLRRMGKAREDDADFAIVKDEEMDEHLIEYRPEDLKTGQDDSSEDDSDDSELNFVKNKTFPTIPSQPEIAASEFATRYKYICLFTQINKHPSTQQQGVIQRLLLENSVDLMVFNIATQNANMLDLKQLSKITPKSMFISANTSLESIFGKSRQNHLQKKMYLEFF